MRRLFLLFVVLGAMMAAMAQAPDTTLILSKSTVAVKITDPERQLTAFAPLFAFFDGLDLPIPPGSPAIKPAAALKEIVTKLKEVRGLNMTGSFWIVMPSITEQGAADAADEEMVDDGDAEIADDAELEDVDKAEAGEEKPACFLVVPLADAQAFQAYVKEKQATPNALPAVVCGDKGVIALGQTVPPAFTKVVLDVQPQSTRDLVILLNMPKVDEQTLPIDPVAMPFMNPVLGMAKEYEKNWLRYELGLAMVGEDFSAETNLTPVEGSPLAQAIAALPPSTLPLDYAAYMPDNLAYCSASGPMLNGAPGVASVAMQMVGSMIIGFMPEDRQAPFTQSLQALMLQCCQGRVIGITVPPANGKGPSSVVAVYHVTNAPDAQAAVRGFVRETLITRDSVMGGAMANVFKLELLADAEKVGTQPVDVIKFRLESGQPTAGKAGQPFNLECRVSYLNDKLLFTAGSGSREEMAALIGRIQQKGAGYTKGARFTALQQGMPTTIRGFESFATVDLIRAVANTFAPEKERQEAMRWLGVFPPQRTSISTYQEVKDGRLHGEIRLPAEQLNFLYMAVKMAKEANAGKAQPAAQ